jgi:hypothetical protein
MGTVVCVEPDDVCCIVENSGRAKSDKARRCIALMLRSGIYSPFAERETA